MTKDLTVTNNALARAARLMGINILHEPAAPVLARMVGTDVDKLSQVLNDNKVITETKRVELETEISRLKLELAHTVTAGKAFEAALSVIRMTPPTPIQTPPKTQYLQQMGRANRLTEPTTPEPIVDHASKAPRTPTPAAYDPFGSPVKPLGDVPMSGRVPSSAPNVSSLPKRGDKT